MNAPERSLWAQKKPILGYWTKHNKNMEENVALKAEPVLNNRKKPAITSDMTASDERKQSISFLMMRMKTDTNPQILLRCQMQCF
jgi:hypothetical protein